MLEPRNSLEVDRLVRDCLIVSRSLVRKIKLTVSIKFTVATTFMQSLYFKFASLISYLLSLCIQVLFVGPAVYIADGLSHAD